MNGFKLYCHSPKTGQRERERERERKRAKRKIENRVTVTALNGCMLVTLCLYANLYMEIYLSPKLWQKIFLTFNTDMKCLIKEMVLI